MRGTTLSGAILTTFLLGCASSRNNDVTTQNSPANSDDLVIYAGALYTPAGLLRDQQVVVRGGRVASISPITGTSPGASGGRFIDARGLTVLPGLADAHAHIESLGKALETVPLVDTRSYEEVIARLKDRAAQAGPGEWILGRGWDQNDWEAKDFPDAALLDTAVPVQPVWVERIDGHAALANSAAMRAAGITAETPDPAGGRILRRPDGTPTGVFIDAATNLIDRVVPSPTREVRKRRIRLASETIASFGLTSVHDAGVDQTTVELFRELADASLLPIRAYLMLADDAELLKEWFRSGPSLDYRELVTVRSVKLFADGALGSRGAALLEPYSDDGKNSGLLRTTAEHIEDVARRAKLAGFQVNTHAIGDRGVRIVLDAYARAGVNAADRFRIEHLQVISPEDLGPLVSMGIIASVQPTHATSDMPWAEARIGPARIRGAYAWRKVLASGGKLALGSDFPVEEVNPWFGIYAAVTRKDRNGSPAEGWYSEERLTLEESLKGFSLDAAYAAFQEEHGGTIETGKRADFTIVDKDPHGVEAARLHQMVTRYTIVGGRVTFEHSK